MEIEKTEFDYALNWDEWHTRDLEDMIVRDRNHPYVFIWSIGNEVTEQRDKQDSSGSVIAKELAATVRNLASFVDMIQTSAACSCPSVRHINSQRTAGVHSNIQRQTFVLRYPAK